MYIKSALGEHCILRIVIGTWNRGKEKEIRRILSRLPVRLISLRDIPDSPRVREDGVTFRQNARKKALTLARVLGMLVLAEDSGIEVDALKGRPGVFSAHYAGEGASDEANNEKLLKELRGIPAKKRTARYRCVAVLAGPEGVLAEADGVWEGRIACRPKGKAGFGYDPIFIVPQYGKTVAELGGRIKGRLSHRAQALRKIKEFLMMRVATQRTNALMRKAVRWMRSYVAKAGARGIVFGLSGGIDSSLVGALAKAAVGRNALGLIMPCHSDPGDERDARLVARKFGIRTHKVDLSDTYDTLVRTLPEADRVTMANIKARLRMTVLYYFANKLNYIVAGATNKSELMVGYFTKHGDGGSDILPIGDILKRDVRKMAWAIGVPQKIIEKAPSAGLWTGQTDEGEMGITYDELDAVLAGELRNRELKRKVTHMISRSEHKRKGPVVMRC